MTTFRQTAWDLSPSRLRTTTAARMVYAFIGLPLDMIAEATKEALLARFPQWCVEDALAYHGRDRGIRRGVSEPSASYRARLLLWIEAWKAAGAGRSILDQIAGFLTPHQTRIRLWTQVGVVYERSAAGVFTVTRLPGLWNWDGLGASLWARFWIIIDSFDGVPWSRDGTWGDGEVWGSSATSTWGSTATIAQVQTIRAIVDDWKPAAAVCKNIIVSFDDPSFEYDPMTSTTSTPFPDDGTWAHWSKNVGGVQVPARSGGAIYWDGVA